MKKLLTIIYTSLFIACCCCFFIACIDPIEPPALLGNSAGEGTFSLVIGSEAEPRTILPTTVQGNFVVYTLVFSSTGRDNVSVDRTNSNLANSVTLPAATWNLTVTAYMDSIKTKPAARESLTGIVITAGANVSRSLELKPIIENGATGTFSWYISYPSDVTVASMKITPLNTDMGTPEQTLFFKGGTPLVSSDNTYSPLSLNTGYYRVVFSLSNGQHSTGREEYLHVYKNMNSQFKYSFTQDHFTILSVTNGNDSGPGSLRHAIANAASGNTILIESGVGTILLTSRLLINKNLTIAGNGVTITRATSWTTDDTTSQLLYISGSGITVIINRILFKDGRASNGSAVYVASSSVVNLESCVFSGNQGTNNQGYGAIYNNGTLNVKGNTFYSNKSNYGGAIYNSGTLTLAGNLFYGNTAITSGPVVRNTSNGNASSAGYNIVDAPLGTTATQSGWTGHSTDKTISGMPIAPATFRLLSGRGAQNVITSRPGAYPEADFYGNPIPPSGAAAGAIQSTASGYLVELSVNNGMGSAAITSAPALNADGLYPSGGSVTLTATSTGPAGYGFQYWLVDNTTNPANPLTLTLSNHSRVQAVFGRSSSNFVQRVVFSGATNTVTLNCPGNNEVFLVKVNTSKNIVDAADTGGPSGSSPSPSLNLQSNWYAPEMEFPSMGHPAADEYNANPPPIVDEGPRRSRAVFVPPKVGDTRKFRVESYFSSGIFVEKQATLRATGQYGNIWIMDENYGSGGDTKVNAERAQELAVAFDKIYPVETKLLGYENGGGPGGDGGIDGDPKVQILVYAILNASGESPGVSGFFWGKDLNNSSNSNLAEMFYVNAYTANRVPYVYSLMVHEFQHLINFSMKFVRLKKASESWYDEMLSMMAEDIIAPFAGVDPTLSSHVIRGRIPLFLDSYNEVGVTEWTGLSSVSYSKGCAFGAYLLRNYGGASLLQEILANDSVNVESITAALNKIAGNGMTFEEALRRYGEAMVFSGTNMPADVQSFDKTVTKTIGGTEYTATKVNIWTDFGIYWKPKIFGANQQLEMRPHSMTVHQDASWKGRTGNVTITLQQPVDPDVEFYLMIK